MTTIRAIVLEHHTDGAKSVSEIFEMDNITLKNMLRFVKRRLVWSFGPHSSTIVTIQVRTVDESSKMLHNKEWVIPERFEKAKRNESIALNEMLPLPYTEDEVEDMKGEV